MALFLSGLVFAAQYADSETVTFLTILHFFHNLLVYCSNAIYYSGQERGQINIRAKKRGFAGDIAFICIKKNVYVSWLKRRRYLW